MATLRFKDIGIRAMAACVPRQVVSNRDLGYLIPDDEIDFTIRNIGVEQRRIADPGCCASDLCFAAAQRLMQDNDIAPSSIDVLLFMSQTADYRIPATAPLLQHRLGLPTSTMAMDLSLGCSGWVYALSAAYAYAAQGLRVLLLDGETFSKIVNRFDKVDWPLYGDAGTATLVEAGPFGESLFMLHSDGSGRDAVIVSDGMRNPVTANSLAELKTANGDIHSGLEVYMDGMEVFNFAMKRVPKSIKDLAAEGGFTLDEVDHLVFHQANRFMTDFFVKKLKFPPERVPYCLDRYGNTSSASVPLTMVSELPSRLNDGARLVLSSFGAGLSWAAASIIMQRCSFSPVIEY